MLTLTRPHRQIAATLAVLAFLVAPTVYVGLTAWRIHQPGHRRAVEAELSRQLGLRVSLATVRYPRPGVVAYRGVVLGREEAGRAASGPDAAELARAGAVRIRRDGRQLTMEADGLRIRGGQGADHLLGELAAMLQRLGSGASWGRISMLAPTCELAPGPDLPIYVLQDVAWTYQADGDASRLTSSCRVVRIDDQAHGDGPAPRCELALVRERRADGLHTTLTLRSTDGEPLPARVLDPFFSARDWLGPRARVAGEVVLQRSGSGPWEARFRGTLEAVDLAALAGRVAPQHRLGGLARVAVESSRWAEQPGRGPGWVEARGTITSTTPGTIGGALLDALRGQLGFRLADRVGAGSPDQQFQQLGLAFAIEPDGGIRLNGALEGPYQPDAVLVDGRSFAPLAFAPEGPATVPGLIRTLAPSDDRPEQMIPARFESLLIQRYLPAPPVDGAIRQAALDDPAPAPR